MIVVLCRGRDPVLFEAGSHRGGPGQNGLVRNSTAPAFIACTDIRISPWAVIKTIGMRMFHSPFHAESRARRFLGFVYQAPGSLECLNVGCAKTPESTRRTSLVTRPIEIFKRSAKGLIIIYNVDDRVLASGDCDALLDYTSARRPPGSVK